MELRRGSLIRQKDSHGSPHGPWLQVIMSDRRYVYAYKISDNDRNQLIFQRKTVWQPKTIKLQSSKWLIDRVILGIQTSLIHPCTKKWVEAVKSMPDVIVLYTNDGRYHVAFTVVDAVQIIKAFDRCVRIYIGQIIAYD